MSLGCQSQNTKSQKGGEQGLSYIEMRWIIKRTLEEYFFTIVTTMKIVSFKLTMVTNYYDTIALKDYQVFPDAKQRLSVGCQSLI